MNPPRNRGAWPTPGGPYITQRFGMKIIERCALWMSEIKLRAIQRTGKLRESLSRRRPSVVPKRHCSCLSEEFIQSRTTQRELNSCLP